MNGQLESLVACRNESGSVKMMWYLLNHGNGKMKKVISRGGMKNLRQTSFVKRVVSGD
jgi:hypothetical protein